MSDPDSGNRDPAAYFEKTFRTFENVTRSDAILTRRLLLGGRIVELQVSTGAMARAILPALSHLVTNADGEPDLVLRAWDSDSLASPPVSPGWRVEDYRRDGFISGFNDRRFHTALQFDPLILRMLDMETRRAIWWTPSATALPHWEIGAPMRPLLHEWLQRMGFVSVHGGAVGTANAGIFLAGAGGRGKSNVALSCLQSGLFYASDDFCFLSQSPEWKVHSLYCTGKLAGKDLGRHPHLRGMAGNSDRLAGEKAIFFLNDRFGDRIIRSIPLRCVVLPRVVGTGAGKLVPISPAAAQRETAMSTIELSRWTGQATLVRVTAMLRDLPCFELQIGERIAEVPDLLAGLLNDLGP